MSNHKFIIQDKQYSFPYHYLIDFESFNNFKVLSWGWEYYAYVNKVLEIVLSEKNNSILDFGCGEGRVSSEMAKVMPLSHIKGIDLSSRAILFAKAFNYGKKIDFTEEDIRNVKEKFDVVVAVEVMEHIPDEEIGRVFKNISSILNNRGRLIISVPSDNFPVQSKHYRHYNLNMIKEQSSGFEIEKLYYVVRGGFIYNLINKLFGRFCSFLFIRKILFIFSKYFLFEAKESNAKHLVISLRKL